MTILALGFGFDFSRADDDNEEMMTMPTLHPVAPEEELLDTITPTTIDDVIVNTTKPTLEEGFIRCGLYAVIFLDSCSGKLMETLLVSMLKLYVRLCNCFASLFVWNATNSSNLPVSFL